MTTYIYILICPIDHEIKYVGKANDPKRRLRDHYTDFRARLCEFKRAKWLRDLFEANLKPEMEIIDEIEMDKWKYWETWWIQYFKSIGCKLLNSASGGNGLTTASATSFQKGNTPWNKGLKFKK